MVTSEVFRKEKLQHSIRVLGDVPTLSEHEAGSKLPVTSLCVCVHLFGILILKALFQAK